MKFILIYYGRYEAGQDEIDAAERKFTDTEAVEAYGRDINTSRDTAVFLREAEAFDGQVEVHGNELPKVVVVLGDGEAMAAVREAYETVKVEVLEGVIDNPKLPEGATDDGGDDAFGGDINQLKAKATELGISFSPTIGYNNLLSRVNGKLKEKEQSGEQ